MQTLKDIKDALKEIPDDTLRGLHFGLGEGSEETVGLIAFETGTISKEQEGYPGVFDKYKQLGEIDGLIRNIVKAQGILDKQDEESEDLSEKLFEDGITSEKFFNKK